LEIWFEHEVSSVTVEQWKAREEAKAYNKIGTFGVMQRALR
jgi:hypothetical protein